MKEKKIGRRSRFLFVVFTLAILISLQFSPIVLAEEIYDESYSYTVVDIPYGNGIDDDGDGTIDEDDGSEPDVYYGTKDITQANNSVYDTWYADYIQNGVVVGGSYEELWEIDCSENVSTSPTQTCKHLSTVGASTGSYVNVTNVINVVTFYIEISTNKLMNGASELWYRSPLNWDDSIYAETGGRPYHYLNIYDDDNNLVWANTNPAFDAIPNQTQILDGSGRERLYYKINMNFKTDMTYRFEEYVKTDADNPINSVQLFMARQQDIASDENMFTYVFWGTTHARKINTECSWSCIFTLGKGLQGGEKIIFGGENQNLITQWFSGDTTVNDTGSLTVILPLRTTRPLNITVDYRINSGGARTAWLFDADSHDIINACGTLIYSFNVTDNNVTEPNYYQIRFNFTNLDEDYNGVNKSNQAVTFYMYPSAGSGIDSATDPYSVILIENATSGDIEANHFFAHIEIASEIAGDEGEGSEGADALTMLVGFAILIIGIILIASVIGAVIGIPILFSGITIATGTCLAAGVGAAAIGTALIWAGSAGYSLSQVWQGFAEGTVRVFQAVIKGIQIVGGIALGIAKMAFEVVTRALWLTLRAFAEIVEAINEIIWFIAFVVVLLLWSWFLTLMKYILRGDIEGVWAAIKKPLRKVERRTRQIYKWNKRENAAGRREGRAERRTDAYVAAQGRRYKSKGVFEK
jgi:hypothetical protein